MSRPKQTHFYATGADLEPGIRNAEAKRSVQYVARGLFADPIPHVYQSLLDVPDFGISVPGELNLQPFYLALDAETQVQSRSIPQRRGGVLYGIDELSNPTSLIIIPGGRHGEGFLIAGKIVATSDSHSQHLYRLLRPQYLRGFTKVDVYLVGPEAYELWKQGKRLTHGEYCPPDYDLHELRSSQ